MPDEKTPQEQIKEGIWRIALQTVVILVAISFGGLTEIVRKSGCGVVVEPTAEGVLCGLSEAIRLKPHWREMGQAGRIWAERHLSWEAIAADTWTRYERILTGADRNPVGT